MDAALVIRAQHGDEAAFAELTVAMGGRLHRVAYGILRDRALAEDATQQALLDIWRKLPGLRDPSRFEAWSYRFLVHACSAEGRRSRHSLPVLIPMREPVTLDAMSGVVDREQLERGFERLSVEHRAVIVLHHYFDLTLADTAEALGVSVGTAKSRLNRAMANLRRSLQADAPSTTPAREEMVR
jgi:RNA polymerase sigma-70 factor (ECF subfamily)